MASISPPPPPRATPTGRNSVSERVSELHHPLSTNTTTTTITTTTNAYIRIYIYIYVYLCLTNDHTTCLFLSPSLSVFTPLTLVFPCSISVARETSVECPPLLSRSPSLSLSPSLPARRARSRSVAARDSAHFRISYL